MYTCKRVCRGPEEGAGPPGSVTQLSELSAVAQELNLGPLEKWQVVLRTGHLSIPKVAFNIIKYDFKVNYFNYN